MNWTLLDKLSLVCWDWEGTLVEHGKLLLYADELVRLFDSQKIVQVVISNANAQILQASCRQLNWPMRLVLGWGLNLELKPHPAMINYALSQLQLNKQEVIFFGDSATDMQAAYLAGIQGYLIEDGLKAVYDYYFQLYGKK